MLQSSATAVDCAPRAKWPHTAISSSRRRVPPGSCAWPMARTPQPVASSTARRSISAWGAMARADAPATPAPADTWTYLDGKLVRYDQARIGLLTHALHYGTACFEGLRAYRNP